MPEADDEPALSFGVGSHRRATFVAESATNIAGLAGHTLVLDLDRPPMTPHARRRVPHILRVAQVKLRAARTTSRRRPALALNSNERLPRRG